MMSRPHRLNATVSPIMLAAATCAMLAGGLAQDEAPPPPAPSGKPGRYVFKPLAIDPSPNGKGYVGRFVFINRGPKPVRVSGFDEPLDGKFVPRFVRYEIWDDGDWAKIPIGYCGTGAMDYAMEPDKAYEFVVDLDRFQEDATPLTCRIGVGDFSSYPFVLDWTKDRESGEFAAVQKEHVKNLRSVFTQAGFKPELLAEDDFCRRLLQAMMQKTSKAGTFKPFVGKLDITPGFELDGKIRIDFTSDEQRNYSTEYRGWFSLDPKTFNPRWFRKARAKHINVGRWGDDGIRMELDDGTNWKAPFYFSINYVPFRGSKTPSVAESRALFLEMLDVLDSYLRD